MFPLSPLIELVFVIFVCLNVMLIVALKLVENRRILVNQASPGRRCVETKGETLWTVSPRRQRFLRRGDGPIFMLVEF